MNPRLLSILLLCSLGLHLYCMYFAELMVEEAYYWNYAEHLDLSYLDHPPMVALLIKLGTQLFGTNEFGVRVASLACWFVTAFFSYQLCEQIAKTSGRYALMLLAVLPFFFFQSIIITPDTPLTACWSASLYYLYQALVKQNAKHWYSVGVCLGLGLLSKYTIVLLGLSALIYIITNQNARFWFRRKEPYLATLITFILFLPVIYWNATHEWVSFIFQSSRRFNTHSMIDTHNLLAIVALFITPIGLLGLWHLWRASKEELQSKYFFQIFTFIPLGFFVLFSLNHEINFNWAGPLFLALIPWLAKACTENDSWRTMWYATAYILIAFYTTLLLVVCCNQSERLQQTVFIKVIEWEALIKNLHKIALTSEEENHHPVVFAPLDKYSIASELAFYQEKLFKQGMIKKKFPVIGAHIFNSDSLMYRYWDTHEPLVDKALMLISKEPWRFDEWSVVSTTKELSSPAEVWSVGQGRHVKNIPYYYKIVRLTQQPTS